MAYFNIVVLYDDYVEDLPSFPINTLIKDKDSMPLTHHLGKDTHNYYYLIASKLEYSVFFTKMSVLQNESGGENDNIDVCIPNTAIKIVFEQQNLKK